MRRITLSLTDEEYAELERRAAQERRTPREMAAFLVTKSQPWPFTPDWTHRPIPYPSIAPQVPAPWITKTTDGTGNLLCGGCTSPGMLLHTCNQWQITSGVSGGTLVN